MRRLPNDVARCWDEKCNQRHQCLRSLGRYDDGAPNFILTCQKTSDIEPYPHFIQADPVLVTVPPPP